MRKDQADLVYDGLKACFLFIASVATQRIGDAARGQDDRTAQPGDRLRRFAADAFE